MTVAQELDDAIYFLGYGQEPFLYVAHNISQPTFQGGAFAVSSRADLDRAATLGGAEVTSLAGPGGGFETVILDPDGYPLRFVWDQELRNPEVFPSAIVSNFEGEKPRKGEFLRFECRPAMVHKLGHFGVSVKNFHETYDFYTKNFNLVASDIVTDGEDTQRDIGAFLHIDLGETFTDHHSFFFMEMPSQHVHHSSFEVHDFDTQMLGHKFLAQKGYLLEWGHHTPQNQVFDYWRDPVSGFVSRLSV